MDVRHGSCTEGSWNSWNCSNCIAWGEYSVSASKTESPAGDLTWQRSHIHHQSHEAIREAGLQWMTPGWLSSYCTVSSAWASRNKAGHSSVSKTVTAKGFAGTDAKQLESHAQDRNGWRAPSKQAYNKRDTVQALWKLVRGGRLQQLCQFSCPHLMDHAVL